MILDGACSEYDPPHRTRSDDRTHYKPIKVILPD